MSAREEPVPTRSRLRPAHVVAIGAGFGLAGVALAAALGGLSAGFPLDDAWIHMVYGRALAHGEPFAYSPGETASGFTSPLWVVLVGLAHLALERVSVDAVVHAVQGLGALAHVGAAALAARLALALTRRPLPALAAAAIVGLAPALANAALTGMEVTATGAALLGAVTATVHGPPRSRPWRVGAWLAAAVMLRPDSLSVALTLAAVAVLTRKRAALGAIARAAVPVALAGLALVAAYYTASGRPLPATFYFKAQSSLSALPTRLGVVLGDILPTSAPFLGFVGYLFCFGAMAAPGPARFPYALPALSGLAWLVAVAFLVDPNDASAFYFQRYFLPAVPLLGVAIAVGGHALGARLPTERLRPVPLALAALVAVAGTAVTAPVVSRHRASDVRNIDQVQRAMGRRLAAIVPPDGRIATCDAGAVRYFSNRPTIDLLGLNSPDLWWVGEAYVEAHPVTHVAIMPAWIQPTRGVERLGPPEAFRTTPYTITSNPQQAVQYVAACVAPGPVLFEGMLSVPLICNPR
ncbi:MAG: hypothetical protein R3B82_02110 [Sandaracinaceae bacterium]